MPSRAAYAPVLRLASWSLLLAVSLLLCFFAPAPVSCADVQLTPSASSIETRFPSHSASAPATSGTSNIANVAGYPSRAVNSLRCTAITTAVQFLTQAAVAFKATQAKFDIAIESAANNAVVATNWAKGQAHAALGRDTTGHKDAAVQ